MSIQSKVIATLSLLLILVGCRVSETTPPGDIKIGNLEQNIIPVDKPKNTKNTLKPNPLPTPIQKFYDEWSSRYDSNLSPSQHAYCLTHSNKKSFTVLKNWIFLVNEEPRKIDGKVYGVLETKCSAILTLFSADLKPVKLHKGSPIIASGKFRGNVLTISEYVKLD